ncbi:methyltransferase domain-containing protein [Roseomonas sp. SSH11]|uniref:Methyltransferase domain-containing protein n=1 Tax=Pararoseomonas baculiformis TaxID=2820812 RepID=A0ABS4AKI2_9PROT|nr:class I SAM-dependent methyltransferase [Pararoseomonas baculiformis]MBP0447010.1 methyltransferase domain-containing protein [Pararoseomonas baculiformis]
MNTRTLPAADSGEALSAHRCPICGGTEFSPFNGREMARCASCKAVERNRLLWMLLQKMGVLRTGMRVLHMAPETGIARQLWDLCGDRYHPSDIEPERYRSRFVQLRPMDLCTDLQKLPSRSFDLILHSHVLEHLPCDVEAVLGEMERILAPGGHHFFSVPIRGDATQEDLDERLTPDERRRLFGQDDHMRIFGATDLVELLQRVWGDQNPVIEPLSLLTPEELASAGIPDVAWRGISGHSVFHRQRPVCWPLRIRAASVPPAPLAGPHPPPVATGGPRLILVTGARPAGVTPMERWLRSARSHLQPLGVQAWPAGEDPMATLFAGFGTPERLAGQEGWLRRAQARPGGLRSPEAARVRLDAWLDSLGEGTGLLLADGLWTMQPPEISALAGHLAARRVRASLLCWLRPPAEQIAAMLEDRLLRDLSPDALGPGIGARFAPSYKRLDAWLGSFGPQAVTLCLSPGEAPEAWRTALAGLGIAIPETPLRGAGPAEPKPSLTAARALLALRRGGPGSAALEKRLARLEGEPLAFPEAVWRRLEPVLAREIGYLAGRFGLDPAALQGDVAVIDDAAFQAWDAETLRRLCLALDQERPAGHGDATTDGERQPPSPCPPEVHARRPRPFAPAWRRRAKRADQSTRRALMAEAAPEAVKAGPEKRAPREAAGTGNWPVSRINLGMRALLRDNPWPEFGYGEIEPFHLALDGNGRGGRELVTDIIKQREVSLMVEIGCFLGGSTLQWLRSSEKLTVIGVDPWDDNWAAYIERIAQDPVQSRSLWHLGDEKIASIVADIRRHGSFCVAMNNLRLYKQRFYPVRRRSPEALHYLHARGIVPELIYIDAGKHREDLDAAFDLFPDSILCGDDWLWPDATGVLRMQEHVKAFAAEKGFTIQANRQTWLLLPPEKKGK